MSKMSESRKIKKGLVEAPKKRRNLNKQELQEYLEILRFCNGERWKAMQISGNTALVPNGQEVAKTQEAIANLLDNTKNNWLSQVLTECGVPKGQAVNINSVTGEIQDTKTEIEKKLK